jgi:DNA-binding CsgD family transcriptional regulator
MNAIDFIVRPDSPPYTDALADVIAGIGTPDLPVALDSFLQGLVPFDLSVIFGYPFDRTPLLLYDGYRDRATRAAMDAYLRGAYLLDPFYTASVQGHPAGLWRMRQLSPEAFFESDFYSAAEVHPCISMEPGSLVEEIGFLVPLPAGFTATYSLMRSRGRHPFTETEMQRLRAVTSIVQQAIRTQWRNLERSTHGGFDGSMEAAFATFCADALTYQQRRIVQLVLRGHSSCAIAALIDVAEGTVKNHRKAIYRRLNISSQSELFAMFLRHVNGK